VKAADKMSEIVGKAESLTELAQILKDEAPRRENCFHCKQRFVGDCPLFLKSKTDIDTLFISSKSSVEMICAVCAMGCMTFKE
jgi:hypothetical protein